MARKAIPSDVQTAVLVKSRRRCCICYGLHRDTGLKQGQIAHIDQDSSKVSEDDLAFMCLDHHDEYDGRRKQSKNLTPQEVRTFRRELHAAMDVSFAPPPPASINVPSSALAGHYIGVGERSADLKLTPIPLSQNSFHVSGATVWGGDDPHQALPAVGEIDFVAEMKEGTLVFSRPSEGTNYRVIIKFEGDRLRVIQEGDEAQARFTFQGTYKKATSVHSGHGAAETSFHPAPKKKSDEE